MKTKKSIILIIIALFLISGVSLFAKEYVSAIPQYPPFSILENETQLKTDATGIYIDFMDLFQERYPQHKIVYHNIPSGRARHMTDNGLEGLEITWTSPMFMSDAANQHFDYAGEVARTKDKVVTRKGSSLVFNSKEDLYGKRVGVILGYGYGEYDELFEQRKIIPDRVPGHEPNILKLNVGRIDAYFGNIHVTPYTMVQLGIDPSNFVYSEETLFEFGLGPFISKRHPQLRDDMSRFIAEIRESGELQAIIDKYTK